MIEIKAWKPKCCNRAYMSKYSALRHEKLCWYNPDNKCCFTCEYHSREQEEGEDYGGYVKYNICKLKDIVLELYDGCGLWKLKKGEVKE